MRLLLIGWVILLGACAPITRLDEQMAWQGHKSDIEIKQWQLQGRLLIRTDDVLNAHISWQHKGEQDAISLFGALGLGKRKIEINGDNISLDSGDGEKLRSNDVDGFMRRQLGFDVPVTALRRWVLGLPVKNSSIIKIKNGFEQLGWRIETSRYKATIIGVMPHKLKIKKNKIKLTLIIDRWER